MIKKVLITFGVVIFLIVLFFALQFYVGDPKLIILNESDTDIKTIQVLVSGNNYTIGSIAAGDKRDLKISPKWDSNIKLIINERDTILIDTYLDQGSTGGYIKVQITEDSLISFTHKRGIL
jgi:hypothetical protein